MYPFFRSASGEEQIINMKLTRAYVPEQPYIGVFPLDEALEKGTLFPNLCVPYEEKHKGNYYK